MDISSTFKAEIFRPIATVAIPGVFAIFPYLLIATDRVPRLSQFWDTQQTVFISMFVLAAVTVGLIIEDIGSQIEIFWDRIIARRHNKTIQDEWFAYLRLSPSPNQIGHQYLSTITLRLKFELAFSLSLIPFWLGVVWFNTSSTFMSCQTVVGLTLLIIVLIMYLAWESYGSSRLLSDLRRELLK